MGSGNQNANMYFWIPVLNQETLELVTVLLRSFWLQPIGSMYAIRMHIPTGNTPPPFFPLT